MKAITITQYNSSQKENWDSFVKKAKNATFLMERDFMDYHSDRFEDFSLIVWDGNSIVALLPANRFENVVHSHSGLSYGGLIVSPNIRIKEYVTVFKSVLEFLKQSDIQTLKIKLLPTIYHATLADEIDVISFLTQAQLYRTDVYLVIDNQMNYNPNRNRRRALKIAVEQGLKVKEETDYSVFWNKILTPNLQNRFGVNPVHSLEEIELLAEKFPNQIKLYNAYLNNEVKAGVVIFIFDKVVHFQYSSGGEDRTDTAALDYLFDYIVKAFPNHKYISFGSVSEENGTRLNEGLAYWKESFGAKTTVQRYLSYDTSNFNSLNSLLV